MVENETRFIKEKDFKNFKNSVYAAIRADVAESTRVSERAKAQGLLEALEMCHPFIRVRANVEAPGAKKCLEKLEAAIASYTKEQKND